MEARLQQLAIGPNQGQVRPRNNQGNVQRGDRTYINVMPVAYASRQGHSVRVNNGGQEPVQSAQKPRPTSTAPAIPRSQAVKQLMEPSYSTILQPEHPPPPAPPPLPTQPPPGAQHQDQPIYANTGGSSVYSYYSELEALRSSDSQGSTEEELQVYGAGPPSPVSSSYSELRQATRRMPTFQPPESMYEPVTPGVRAKTVTVGATLASPYAVSNPMPPPTNQPPKPRKYEDKMSGEYFGLCSKCNMKIIGDGTGCTAMGRLYHIDCFTCTNCYCLLQGKPFYALDGKVSLPRFSTNTARSHPRICSHFVKKITCKRWKSVANV